jgi:putative transposase
VVGSGPKLGTSSGQVVRFAGRPGNGRRHVRYLNDRCRRTGTLREARYRSSLVDRHVSPLRGYRHIELDPIRARMCADHTGSSYRYNALGRDDVLIHTHPTHQGLRVARGERRAADRVIAM